MSKCCHVKYQDLINAGIEVISYSYMYEDGIRFSSKGWKINGVIVPVSNLGGVDFVVTPSREPALEWIKCNVPYSITE